MLSKLLPQADAISTDRQEKAARRRLPWIRIGFAAIMAVVAIWVGWRLCYMYLGTNLHAVRTGQIYRSAQLSPQTLEQVISQHGIRTVINLRGCVPFEPWHRKQSVVTARLGVGQEDINMSAVRVPSATELRHLVRVLDRAETPFLIHCRRGVDRTGLVTATALLLREKISVNEALGQWHIKYGRVSIGKTSKLTQVFDYYLQWLKETEKTHSRDNFRHWAMREYGANVNQCRFEKCELSPQPIRTGQPITARVRVRNTSARTWQLRPIKSAGFHLEYRLYQVGGKPIGSGRAGYFNAKVAPGDSIDLTVPIVSVETPGSYMLVIDMVEEPNIQFFRMGSEPLELMLEIQ